MQQSLRRTATQPLHPASCDTKPSACKFCSHQSRQPVIPATHNLFNQQSLCAVRITGSQQCSFTPSPAPVSLPSCPVKPSNMSTSDETSIPVHTTQTPGPSQPSGAKSIGERVRGLRRGADSESIGKRVASLSRSSRKRIFRPATVTLKKPGKGARAKAVTVSSKKPRKGGSAVPRSATQLEPPRDDLSSFGSPVNLASRLEKRSAMSE